jgi:hypothetical protein
MDDKYTVDESRSDYWLDHDPLMMKNYNLDERKSDYQLTINPS